MGARHSQAMRGWIACLGLLAWLLALPALATTTQSLESGWQLRLAPGDAHAAAHPRAAAWLPATVPGTVQGDLLAAKLVADPYWRTNEAAIQWVGLADWQYRSTFHVDAATLARRHVELVFDGLDTYADITLNGHKLRSTDNMFRRWRLPVKALLREGENTLEVTLHSPIARVQPWLAKQPYALPGEFDSAFGDEPIGRQSANYVRKAAYQYGWDWGPRIVTLGIWRGVRLESWNALRLADFHIAQPTVTADVAQLQAQLKIEAAQAGKAQVTLRWRAPDGATQTLAQSVALTAGDNAVSVPLSIAKPQRWWPVGYGAPNLYDFHVDVAVDGQPVASADRRTGLRSVQLRRDQDQWGRGFALVVNGVPIFAKGANFIPMDSLPERVTPARIAALLASARDANMNMLRIWGGGYYLEDAFYAEADKLGLMVWQDFMFGGAIPPYDAAFRDNTRVEAQEQLRRLRDHPSIVLWCGNNEVETGWQSWGDRKAFKATLAPAERARIEAGMHELFDRTLREAVAQASPELPYWPTSPGIDGAGAVNVANDGDYHYWNVWSGEALPASAYLDITPRFMSEYGLQSLPVLATIARFAEPADMALDSPVLTAHQKFDKGKGNQRLLMYVEREYGKPKDFASLVYLSQVMQAEGIALAATHLRASRPRAMGSLYWQLNDVWPGASWSSVDYFGRWKALHYHAKRFYAPLLIAALRHPDGHTAVSLVSDHTTAQAARWRLRVLDFDGKLLREEGRAATLAPLASTPLASYTDAQLLQGANPHRTLAVFTLEMDGQTLSRQTVYFAPAKQLALPDPGLHAQLAADGRSVTVSAQRLAREVWLDFGALDARLSDNAFDLLPGESRSLQITSHADAAALRQALQVRSLYGATEAAP